MSIRYCSGIGLYAIDRPRSSCVWKTSFCKEKCYNKKLYRIYKNMPGRDNKNEVYWQTLTGEKFKKDYSRKRKNRDRFRFMTRGEGLQNFIDINRVKDICNANKEITFELPTRSWRNEEMRTAAEDQLMPIENLRLYASLDPSNSYGECMRMVERGWSTTFFGDDDHHFLGKEAIKCVKTWHKEKKILCGTCQVGCWDPGQVHVWFKQH